MTFSPSNTTPEPSWQCRPTFVEELEKESETEEHLDRVELIFEDLQIAAERLSASNEPIEISIITELEIPMGASPLLEDFLVAMAEMRNGLAHALQEAGSAASAAGQTSAIERWQERTSATWEQQVQRAQQLAAESAIADVDRPVEIGAPEGASPAVRAFLADRAALANAHAQARSKLKGPPEEMTSRMTEQTLQSLIERLHASAIQLSSESED